MMWGWTIRGLSLIKGLVGLKSGVVWLSVSGLFLGGVFGWYMTASYYQRQIKLNELKAIETMAKIKEKEYAKLVKVVNEYDLAQRTIINLRSRVAWLRQSANDKAISGSATSVGQRTIGNCERLLRESSELLAEGGELLQSNALAHDALVEVIK